MLEITRHFLTLAVLGLSTFAEVFIMSALFYSMASWRVSLHMCFWLFSNVAACSTTSIEVAIFGGWSIYFWYTSGLEVKFIIPALIVDALYCCMTALVNRKRRAIVADISTATTNEIKLEEIWVLPADWTCTICMQGEPPAVTTQCGHGFHKACIETWAQKSATCPLCRSRL